MNKIKNFSLRNYFYLLLIIIISLSSNFYSGLRGIFPIDSFLIFNSGYNVINGVHPFKDYWSITGPLLDYLQALFFSILGVNWYTYVFHAAFLNTIFSITVFYLFKSLSLNSFYSAIFALSAGILAYPSIGTPFVDHHASIFATLSISFAILGIVKRNNKFWFISSFIIILAFFSKQVPTAYIFIFLTIILLSKHFFINKDNSILYFISGLISGFSLFLFFTILFKIPLENFFIQYILYPISIGENRIENLNIDLKNTIFQFKYLYLALLPSLTSILILKKKKIQTKNKQDILIALTVIGSTLIFIYSQLMTKNQVLIFYLIPWCLGFSYYLLTKYYKKNINNYIVIFFLIIATVKYHVRFNIEKKFMELSTADFSMSVDGQILDKSLKGLNWISPRFINNPTLEINLINQTKNFVIKDKKNKIIITNYQILPMITKNMNFAPNKWFDDLSEPNRDNEYFETYQNFFYKSLKKQNIQNVYLVGGEKKMIAFKRIFNKKNCLKISRVNQLTTKINIENCKF